MLVGAALCERWDTLSCWRGSAKVAEHQNGITAPLLQPTGGADSRQEEGPQGHGRDSAFAGSHGSEIPNGDHLPNEDHHDFAGDRSESGLEAEGSERSAAVECPCLPSLGEGRHCACVADHGLVGPCSCPQGVGLRLRKGDNPLEDANNGHPKDRGQGSGTKGSGVDVCPGPAALLHSDADRREFISAGAAAGLAVRHPPAAFADRRMSCCSDRQARDN